MGETRSKRPEMGKWELWKFFSTVTSVRPYLPPTELMTKSSLRRFLSIHRAVYVKPNYGQCGNNVMKVLKSKNGGYALIREKGPAVSCRTLNELHQKLKIGRRQVVQKAIPLAQINGCPFDVRVLMMRDGKGEWRYVGMLAKVAGPGWVITNKRSNGKALPVDQALKTSLHWKKKQIKQIQEKMIHLGHEVCKRFDDYKRYRQIGIDMGIDSSGKLWIIEENTGPGWVLFKKLDDLSMYELIRDVVRERSKKAT